MGELCVCGHDRAAHEAPDQIIEGYCETDFCPCIEFRAAAPREVDDLMGGRIPLFASPWHGRFFDLARLVGSWSKDPRTKVGAVLVDQQRRIVSVGYNGFPRFTADDPELYADRDYKLAVVVHAELNAILNASDVALGGGRILYTTLFPCGQCAAAIINARVGISEVHCPVRPDRPDRAEDWRRAEDLLRQANVAVWCHPGQPQ